MEKNIELKRPLSIKWSIGILIALFVVGLIVEISQHGWKASDILKSMLSLVLLFAIWQGRRWARNILFFLVLFILPLLVAGSGLLVTNPTNLESIRDQLWFTYGFFGTVLFLVSIYMMFMKSSNKWFAMMKGEQFHEQTRPSWHFQLTLLGISIGLGFLVIAVNTIVSFISFGKEVMMNFSTYYSRFAVLLTFESLGFLIGVIAVILPFGFIIGYWKKVNIFFMTRLITMGAILPVLLFPVGNTLFQFCMFFLSKVLIIGIVTYIGLRFGVVTARYVDTLRVPIEIK